MRVQIHLNLAQPQQAENVVRIQTSRGNWVGVAYATHLIMRNVVPVVDRQAQQAVANGLQKKTPHAFLEGELLHCVGRIRDKAPQSLKDIFSMPVVEDFHHYMAQPHECVNYNPRFATCFFRKGDVVAEKFIHADTLVVVGWNFYTSGNTFEIMAGGDYVHKQDGTSLFEKVSMARGRKTSEELLHRLELTPTTKLG